MDDKRSTKEILIDVLESHAQRSHNVSQDFISVMYNWKTLVVDECFTCEVLSHHIITIEMREQTLRGTTGT